MQNTLISPLAYNAQNIPSTVRKPFDAVERAVVAAIADCNNNDQRLQFWTSITEYAQQNLANVDGQIGRAATGSGRT